MAAPFRTYATGFNGVPSIAVDATWTPSTPPNLGDLVVVVGHSASGAITAPVGWTEIDHSVQGSIHTHIWTRTYTAGMTGVAQVFTGPASDYSISVSAYSHAAGASGLTLSDLAIATDATGSAYPVNIVAPSTASVTDSLLLNFYAWRDARFVTGVTYPTGMSDVFYPNWPYSSSGSAGVAGLTSLTSAGTAGTKTIVVSASAGSYVESVTYSFLIKGPAVPFVPPLQVGHHGTHNPPGIAGPPLRAGPPTGGQFSPQVQRGHRY